MKPGSRVHHSRAYQAFFAIDPGEYRQKILFADKYRKVINELELPEYVEIMDAYAESLFETGQYESHIIVADLLIELSIIHNIREIDDRDLYFETLFQKAASLYNLERNSEAVHILKELLKINPKHESCRLFLINCHVKEQASRQRKVRKASVTLILVAAVIITFELVLARPFFPEAVTVVEALRNLFFVVGVLTLVLGELGVRYTAVARMYEDVNHDK